MFVLQIKSVNLGAVKQVFLEMSACYLRYTVSVWDLGQYQHWLYLPIHLGTWSSGQNFFFRSASLFLCFLFYKVWLTSKHCKYLRCTLWCFDIRKVHLLRGRWNPIKNFLWKFSSFLPSSLLSSFVSSFISPFLSFSIPPTPSSLPSFLSSFLSLLQKDDLNSSKATLNRVIKNCKMTHSRVYTTKQKYY